MEILNYILSSIIVVATPLIFVKILLDCKMRNNKARIIVVCLTAMILNILVYKYTSGIYRPISSLVIYILTIYNFYNISLNKTIFSIVTYIITLVLLELFVLKMLNIFGMSKEYIYEVFAGSLISNLLMYASVIILTLLLKNLLRKLLTIKISFSHKIVIFSVLTLISILVFFFDIIASFRVGARTIFYMIAIITFVSALIIVVYEETKHTKLKIEYDKLLEFMETYEVEIEKERILRHEYKNQLITIKSKLIDKDKKENIIDYIDNILGDEARFSLEEYTKFQYLPPNGLKALFYFKVSSANHKNIITNINIAPGIKNSILSKLTTKEFKNLGMLIGIYIDNAIDASEKSEEKLLGIEIYDNEDGVTIIISNSYQGIIDESKVGKVHFTTKGKGRGYGLLLVNKILKANNKFESEREITSKLYIQTILIKK